MTIRILYNPDVTVGRRTIYMANNLLPNISIWILKEGAATIALNKKTQRTFFFTSIKVREHKLNKAAYYNLTCEKFKDIVLTFLIPVGLRPKMFSLRTRILLRMHVI